MFILLCITIFLYRRQENLKRLENISQEIVTDIINDEIETITEITNNEVVEENNTGTNDNTMQVDEDEQACENAIMYEQLTAMGLEINDNEERNVCTLQENELQTVLESGNEFEEDENLIIDNNVDAYRVKGGSMLGKCIVDIVYVFKLLHEKFDEHCRGVECSFRDLVFIGARAYGLKNKFLFKCRMCNFESFVWSEPPSEESLNINTGAVAGCILTGVGYTQLQESFAAINIPCMSKKTYENVHETISEALKKAAEESMNVVSSEERELALQHNDVINGIPHIAVIGDGNWMKRSYRTGRYDSLSGVGTICGARTGKVLHMSVRNKYCSICVKAEKLNKEPAHHKCYKNWGQDCSSTSMEADAIVEGFKKSLEI